MNTSAGNAACQRPPSDDRGPVLNSRPGHGVKLPTANHISRTKMKIYTQKHPEGIEILQEKRTDTNRWIDYLEWSGELSDGSHYIVKGNCDYQGWQYSLFIDGERSPLLNDRSPYGKPNAM